MATEPPVERGRVEDTVATPEPGEDLASDVARRIGLYHLVSPIGGGGMGEVWLAEQREPLRRRVAVKIIKAGMDTKEVVARFESERQALALMDHPAIAKVFDGGSTPEGRPYFVMEYVPGVPIDEHCDRHRLSTVERLELFTKVCEGVQHAHQKAIIHRDLKPLNILVSMTDGKAQPKIIDFGIAKAIGSRLTEKTLFTEFGAIIGTPEYMSPEQADSMGQDVDTRTDVYSLGVVLYQLLTGELPLGSSELRSSGFEGLARRLRETEPPRPSSRLRTLDARTRQAAADRKTDPRTLARQLNGDLDAINLKALEKERGRRYGTASELAEDLRRHLTGEPVLARPPSTLYRVQRFVSRHRGPVVAGTMVLAMLVALTGVALVEARRAMLQGRRAEAQARNAEAVRDFLIDVFSAADPAVASGAKPPGDVTVREAVDAASGRIGTSLSDQPEAKVSVLGTLANVYSSLDQVDRSLALLEEALGVAEKALPVPNERQAEVLVRLANTAMFAGRFDVARQWLERSEPVFAALHDRTSEIYAQALKVRGNLMRRGDAPDLPRAAEVLERSVALFRERYPDSDGRLGALFYLAQTLRAANAPVRAEAAADEAVTAASRTVRTGFEVFNAYSLRAAIRDSNGKLSAADEDYRVAHDGYARTVGPAHFLTLQNDALHGFTLLELGGHTAQAMRLMESSAEALGRSRRGSHTHALALERLGLGDLRLGRYAQASRVLETDRALWAERHEALHRTVATVALAQARTALGAHQEAARLLDEALGALRDRPPSADHPEADVHLARALLALETANAAGAREALAKALARSGRESRDDLARRVLAEAALTRLALGADDSPAALAASDRAMQTSAEGPLAEVPRIRAAALEARGASLCAAARGEEGEPMLTRAAALVESVVGSEAPPLLRVRLSLARCLLDRGRRADALALLDRTRRELQPLGPDGASVLPMLQAMEEKVGLLH
jgi:serine/threonine protein kinase/tetratricopeptide (TPR) repeat protein